MIGLILWIIGLVCCVWCIKDVWKKPKLDKVVKILVIIGLLCFILTSKFITYGFYTLN